MRDGDADPRRPEGARPSSCAGTTTYCMPLEVRQRLLDFPEEQSRADLERCQRHVRRE